MGSLVGPASVFQQVTERNGEMLGGKAEKGHQKELGAPRSSPEFPGNGLGVGEGTSANWLLQDYE